MYARMSSKTIMMQPWPAIMYQRFLVSFYVEVYNKMPFTELPVTSTKLDIIKVLKVT
jgi:hypothetical protein